MNAFLRSFRSARARRLVIPAVAAALAAALLVPVGAAAGADGPDADKPAPAPADEQAQLSPEKLDELEKLPDVATARLLVESTIDGAFEAAADYDELAAEVRAAQQEIREHEAEIPRLEAEVQLLDDVVRERAVQAYTGRDNETASILDATSLIDATHRAHLIDVINNRDEDVAETLEATRTLLEARREQLEEQKAEHSERMKELLELQATLDERLAEAEEMLRKSQVLEVWEALVDNREADLAGPTPEVAGEKATAEPDPQPSGSGDVDAPPFIAEIELCPIDAPVFFTNDWGNARSGGRTHKGTDVMAEFLTPNVAVADGRISNASGGLGGTALNLVGEDGTKYYYAHLAKINPELLAGDGTVEAGDVIGWTGDTGNAKGGSPHTHFQIHPDGGAPTNPYFTLFVVCRDNFELPGS
ncbi:MAG: peptidoglycan DD-metalloendopeptidase family protein [Acidimicrobiia bacterium]